ncbi:MAG: type ISP restriction/modification enzyme [Bellilinea sp.]
MTITFEEYIKKIEADYRHGIATEHTYRGTLELLVESFARGVDASNDPKHLACGAPDFIVEKGKVPLGYIETKDVGADLNQIEKSEQMRRYLKALNNLILTDYLEFRWYVNGEKKRTVRVAESGRNGRLTQSVNAAENIENLIKDFFAVEAPTVTSPKELANRLAGVTHFVRDQIIQALNSGDAALQKGLEEQYSAFRDLLLPALKADEFADLYAQAMTYGLFAAKLSAPETEKFTLAGAYQFLFGNKFLRRLFSDVSEELDEIEIIRPYLLDIVSLLNRADFHAILADFGRRTRTEDPVVHFYETFLAAYDPKLRQSRGVYYTPEPVVQFIVRAVDDILKTRFGKPWGLADSSVKVLDPATGTGTFLYYVIQQIHEEVVVNRKQGGQWASVSKELLNRLFGFELLIAPYVVAHLKLGLELKNLGVPLVGRDERLHVYLTNTLEEGVARSEQLEGLRYYISDEASDAALVKKRSDIMVVLGNPPYSANSANTGDWITNLVRESYYPHDDIKEHNPKLMLDDYVKFIRFGEWRINLTDHGILAFITNHGYLDNPTFRGMRQHLMHTFDEIYVLDLHGNSKKKEVAPDGSKDENVFDIQQGVAITIAIKHNANIEIKSGIKTDAFVNHYNLWGLRENKYGVLNEITLTQIPWTKILPQKPFYLFCPHNSDLLPEYSNGYKITEIFPTNSTGMKTHRDHFVFDFDLVPLKKRIIDFRNAKILDGELRQQYGIPDTRDWKLHERRISLSSNPNWQNNLINCLFRAFDIRYTYFHPDVVELPRTDVMKHLVGHENIALCTNRQVNSEFRHILCTQYVVDDCTLSGETRERTYIFPLYIYTTPADMAGTLFAQSETTRKPNLSPAFIQAFSEKLGLTFIPDPLRASFTKSGAADLGEVAAGRRGSGFTPEDVFHYAYAVFHAPTYRTRYAEFLKIDFPRLPLTGDQALFFALADKGRELVGLHLLKSARVDDFITTYPVAGSNRVEKVAFAPEAEGGSSATGRVWINATQYFGGVPTAVWNFKIGGYQVCDKWLKDRKGRVLSGDDISHYQRVVVSLKETMRLMAEIDAVIPGWPME